MRKDYSERAGSAAEFHIEREKKDLFFGPQLLQLSRISRKREREEGINKKHH